jgi:predicted metal-binding membrane protein
LPAPMPEEPDRLEWQSSISSVRHARLSLLVALITLTVGAWALTLYQALEMSVPMEIAVRGGDGMGGMAMAGMPAGGWSFAEATTFVALWTVMMAAMMLPAAAPMILIFASAQTRHAGAATVPAWIFIAGYLLVWVLVGVLVYAAVQIGSDVATQLAPLERARWAPLALGRPWSRLGFISSLRSRASALRVAVRLLPLSHSVGEMADSVRSGWAYSMGLIA